MDILDNAMVNNLNALNWMFDDYDSVCCMQFDEYENFNNIIDFEKHNILIIFGKDMDHQLFIHDLHQYEMRHFILVRDNNTNENDISIEVDNWNSIAYSRHGGICSKWWKQRRNSNYTLHCKESLNFISYIENSVEESDFLCMVYVKISSISPDEHRDKFLKFIGGQSHVRCKSHNDPLVTSAVKERKCLVCHKK